jgi:peptidoglycan/LPS O-acetylase OafA/YrhL
MKLLFPTPLAPCMITALVFSMASKRPGPVVMVVVVEVVVVVGGAWVEVAVVREGVERERGRWEGVEWVAAAAMAEAAAAAA